MTVVEDFCLRDRMYRFITETFIYYNNKMHTTNPVLASALITVSLSSFSLTELSSKKERGKMQVIKQYS